LWTVKHRKRYADLKQQLVLCPINKWQ